VRPLRAAPPLQNNRIVGAQFIAPDLSLAIGEKKAMTKKMKILIPVIAVLLLLILAINIYFSLLAEKEHPWRVLPEKQPETQGK